MEWAVTRTGALCAAKAAFDGLAKEDRAKVSALFGKLANERFIHNREKFRKLGQKAEAKARDLWEFKSFQDRFIGDYRPGKRFLIGAYAKKKKDKLDAADIRRAVDILAENDLWEAG